MEVYALVCHLLRVFILVPKVFNKYYSGETKLSSLPSIRRCLMIMATYESTQQASSYSAALERTTGPARSEDGSPLLGEVL